MSIESWRRTSEIEEFTNLHFVHPIGAVLTRLLARHRVSPNAVSIVGMICGIMAGWAYFHYQDVRYACAGFLLMIAWHVFDGVDGQLARLTNRQSDFGKVVDGLADNVTFISIYLGFGSSLDRSLGDWVWPIMAVAGVVHSMQAAIYELQRWDYDFWGRGKQSAEYKTAEQLQRRKRPDSRIQRYLYAMDCIYARLQYLVVRRNAQDRQAIAGALAAHPQDEALIRTQYRTQFAPLVRTWSVLSSNYRTILIFVCALLNVPLWYFMYEIFALTPVTLLLLKIQSSKSREFTRWLVQQQL